MTRANEADIPLGLLDDGRLVKNPYPNLSRLVIGASGAAKTTSVVMPTALASFGDPDLCVFLNDPKEGECYAQLEAVAQRTGRNFACVDDFGLFGFDNPYRITLNPFGSILTALEHSPLTLNFSIETATHAFVPEVDDGKRNFVFRENSRQKIHTGTRFLAEFKPDRLTPGALCDLMSDPHTWKLARETAAEEGSPALQARARASLELEERNPEAYHRDYSSALSAINTYEAASILNTAGLGASITHEELCRDGWIVCFVLPQIYAQRVGVHVALHQQCILEAQYSGRGGKVRNLLDEMCNSPQKKAVDAVTIQRSSKTVTDYIAQTYADIELHYGKKQAAVLADNCAVLQYLSFSDDDAERVSKLMGEEISIQRSMNMNSERLEITGSMSTGKQPVMAPHELKNLDPRKQVIYLRGYGWLVCNKLFQNQIDPAGGWLGLNPHEEDVLPFDPKVTLPVHIVGETSS